MSKVLYCGMADDIISPLLLTPDVKKIYAVSLFDKSYASKGTWASQKRDIKFVLENGTNKGSVDHLKSKEDGHDFMIVNLEGSSTIISEKDDTKKKRWYLKFYYNGKPRGLIYYYDRNCKIIWPEEISDIRHLMVIGALTPNKFRDDDHAVFRNMMKQRCTRTFSIYARYVLFNSVSRVEGPFISNNEDNLGKLTLTVDVIDVIFSDTNHFCAEEDSDYENPEEEPEYYSDETE